MPSPHRAEHVGSLLRPQKLLQARAACREGAFSEQDLQAIEDDAIRDVIERQRQIGLDVITDGELRRGSWLTVMADATEGFVSNRILLEWKGPGGGMEGSTGKVAGAKLRKIRKMTAHELPLLKKLAPDRFKITLPAPSNFMIASYRKGITDQAYPTRAALLDDVVEIVRDEVQWLVSQGARYIQFDAPYYSMYLDPAQRERMRREGFDADEEFDRAIASDNACMRDVAREPVTLALHVCRGNNRSRWYSEGGYDLVAEKLFESLDVDTFLLEFDDERAGGFEPLRFVPKGKTVVLGLVTTKGPVLESQAELMKRIDEASRYVPLENLALSPQCGFASVEAGNLLSIDDQWRKLELVTQTARRVWQ
jgi:5-methyltetrahydropteroyltriglutamate--homocysteine methyltransferase